MSYSTDRNWSDKFIPSIKKIIGPLLLEQAEFNLDAKEATDLIVLNAKDRRIAARLRRHGYADRYPYEFTIRSKRDSGSKTELEKIVDGFGDWLFYGHVNECNTEISRWMVIDLAAWRAALIRKQAPYKKQSNGDGTHFISFDIRELPKNSLVACSFQNEIDFVERAVSSL